VENYYKGVKQPNHAFFCGFAPRDNPRIAIMCVVENSGRFGGTYAAPIVGLMIEKYLKDSITDPARKESIEKLANLNLIPERIFAELRRQDSIRHSKDSAYLVAKGFIKSVKDTTGIDDEIESGDLDKGKKEKFPQKEIPAKDSIVKMEGILPPEKKKAENPDSSKNNND
jgi:penicillin-binding protein 2